MARFDDSGRLLVGGTSSTYDNAKVQISGSAGYSYLSLLNTTASDSNGNRFSYLNFRGRQSGGEESNLARIGAAHDGTADDQKGRLEFWTNDGNDGNSGQRRMVIAADGEIIIPQGYDIAWRYDVSDTTSTLRGRMTTSSADKMTFHTGSSGTERMSINVNGVVSAQGIYTYTTSTSANVAVLSAGQLYRSTSSSKYKTQVETLQDSYADALLQCRPVWYRSTCEGDNPAHGWWGFIAEEVAEIDPRLVHWKNTEVTYDEKGFAVETPCDPEPEGVAYDRFVPHLLNLIKRQQQAIETLEAKVAALESTT